MQGGAKRQPHMHGGVSMAQIRSQMQKILASQPFARSERMSAFLRFIVESTLRGDGQTLKEQVIAQDVYGRGDDYDPNADPIVRVDARRLRDKLREYYAGAPGDSVFITLPKGSYVPSFEPNPATWPVVVPAPEPSAVPATVPFASRKVAVFGALAVILTVAAGWYALRQPQQPVIRIRPLTSLPGLESQPSLSPDGNFVVFAWSNGGPSDLFIKAVDSESSRRLTETPQPEFSPAWSPDSREIAFIRGGQGVFIESALGGVERKIADAGTRVRWAADSKSIFLRVPCQGSPALTCIDRIYLDTLERRTIVGEPNLWTFSLSPDGRTLAFIGSELPNPGGAADLYAVPVTGGEPKRLTRLNTVMGDVDWTPDGRSLIYAADINSGRLRVWRIPADGSTHPGQPLTTSQVESASGLSVARAARESVRVAYESRVRNISLRVVEMKPSGPAEPIGAAVPLAQQTGSHDCGGGFSPDSGQYVFRSYRSGEGRLWMIGRDGLGLRPLYALGVLEGRPFWSDWSQDGRRIVFSLLSSDGNYDIYVSETAGGKPLRLTTEPSVDAAPRWSPDGQWIYFTSDRPAAYQIWKMPAQGGPATPVSPGLGVEPQTSPDGQFIYYLGCVPDRAPCPLKRVAVTGGPETVVLEHAITAAWSVTPGGIYFLTRDGEKDWLDLFDPSTGKRTRLGLLPFRPDLNGPCGFVSVSPDGRTLIGNHADRSDSNLMLLEISK